jgi:tetratricopeptide (TPR) repeat protein
MIDLVLQVRAILRVVKREGVKREGGEREEGKRDELKWEVQTGTAIEYVDPLTDQDLQTAFATDGQPSMLPGFANTWDGLLAYLCPNSVWLPNARVLERVGALIRNRLIDGKVARQVHSIEQLARADREGVRYVVHVVEGEEDQRLSRLPFELMHEHNFWFRRPGAVGVRLARDSVLADVQLRPGAKVLIAAAHTDHLPPSADELADHVTRVAQATIRAGFVPQPLLDCTPAMLEAALRGGCDLLYVVCHGDDHLDCHGSLALRGGDVTGHQLGEWIAAAGAATGRRVQAALLCACSSAVPGDRPGIMGMAAHLASSDLRAVAALGFRAPIEISWALAFMTLVFDQLAHGASLELAVARARQAQPVDDPAWSLPLLFTAPALDRVSVPAASPRERDAVAPDGQPVLRSRLPALPPRPYFTARAAQLEALRSWCLAPGTAVLTALSGEGGVGKTEIARKLAHEAHGAGTPVLWFDRPDHEIGVTLTAMIRQVVPEYRPPDTATIDDLRADMTRELGPHRGLLVLDDVERSDAVATLTPGPDWNVLVTTRPRALLAGVVEIDVEPLDPEDALTLLVKVAQAGQPFGPDDVAAARGLVVALGGLPFAIEIAGELVRRGWGFDDIRETIQSGIADDHSVIGRVGPLMARSLAGLMPGDEAAWPLVAALPSVGATEQDVGIGLSEPEGRAGRRLLRLRQANLLRFQPTLDRYTMHPLARQVAQNRARTAGTWDDTLVAAAKVVRAVVKWCVELFGRDSDEAFWRWRARRSFFDTLELAHWPPGAAGADDVAAAIAETDRLRALERLPDERAMLLDAAMARASNDWTLANIHLARGDLRRRRDDLDGADADYAHALTLFTAVQDNLGLANVHKALGDLRLSRDDLDGADADYAHALTLYTAVQSNLGVANVHQARGDLRLSRDDLDGADADYAHALTLYTAVQDNLGLATVHLARGDLRRRRDDLDGADADYARALTLFTAAQDNLGLATVHQARGNLRRRRDDLDGADADYARALTLYTSVQSNLGLANVYLARGDLRRSRDDLDGADADYARALTLYTAVQDNLGLANVYESRGDLHAKAGSLDRAEICYLDALPLYERVQSALGLSNVLAELAQTRARLERRSV